MIRRIRGGASAAGGLVVACSLLLGIAGCAMGGKARAGHHSLDRSEGNTVLDRGRLPSGLRWQLVAFTQGSHLGLDLESPSGHSYSAQVGFAASRGYSYHWAEGAGPGNSVFYYGPVPKAAVMVRLSAAGHPAVLTRTTALPAGRGLPRGRFFVIQPPGTVTVSWGVTALDAAGHKIAFTDF